MSLLQCHVSLPYTMTGNTYSLCTFPSIFILVFLLFMMLATLLNAAHPNAMRILISGRRSPACVTVNTYRSTFQWCFRLRRPHVDMIAFSFSITLILLRFMLRPTGLLARCMSVSMLSSSSGELAIRTIIGKDQA